MEKVRKGSLRRKKRKKTKTKKEKERRGRVEVGERDKTRERRDAKLFFALLCPSRSLILTSPHFASLFFPPFASIFFLNKLVALHIR
jgi:hypothetical protein